MPAPLRSALRWPAAALLVVTAATHIPLVPHHLEEAPYVGVLFAALSAVSLLLAALVCLCDTPAVWAATGVVTAAAVVAFVLSRTVGLPQLADDIGNWSEPLGFPALLAEVAAAAVALVALRHTPRLHGAGTGTP